MERKDIYVGMEVRVFDVNARSVPEGGWIGTVTEVRRTKCVVDFPGARNTREFYIESQTVADNYSHQFFRTLEQAEMRAREIRTDRILREHGISFSYATGKPSLEKLEAIAAILEGE